MRSFAVFMVLALISCAPKLHKTTLPLPPSQTEPFEDRLAAYQNLRAGELIALTSADAPTAPYATSVEFIVLVDGTIIDNPEDLVPVVSDDSKTAKDTKFYLRYKQMSKNKFRALRALTALSGVTSLAAFGLESISLGVVSGVSLAGSVGFFVSGAISYIRGAAYRGAALQSYNQSLRTSLGICVDEGTKQIYDCFREQPKVRSGITLNNGPTEVP